MCADKSDKNVHMLAKTITLSKIIWNNYAFWRSQFDFIQHHDATSPYEVKALFPFLFDSRITCTCFKVDYNTLLPLWTCLSDLRDTFIQREKDKLAEDELKDKLAEDELKDKLDEDELSEIFQKGLFIPADSSSPDLLKLMASFFIELDWNDISDYERFVASDQNTPILERPDNPIYLTNVIAVLKSTVATILHNIILLKLLIGQKVFRTQPYDRAIKVMKWACSPLSCSDTKVLVRALLDVEPRINQNAKLPCLRNPKIFDDWSQKEIDDFRQFCVEEDFDNWRAKVAHEHEVSDAKGIEHEVSDAKGIEHEVSDAKGIEHEVSDAKGIADLKKEDF